MSGTVIEFGKGQVVTTIMSRGIGGPLQGLLLSSIEGRLEVGGVLSHLEADKAVPLTLLWFNDPKSIDVLIHQLSKLRLYYGRPTKDTACHGREVDAFPVPDDLCLAIPDDNLPLFKAGL